MFSYLTCVVLHFLETPYCGNCRCSFFEQFLSLPNGTQALNWTYDGSACPNAPGHTMTIQCALPGYLLQFNNDTFSQQRQLTCDSSNGIEWMDGSTPTNNGIYGIFPGVYS